MCGCWHGGERAGPAGPAHGAQAPRTDTEQGRKGGSYFCKLDGKQLLVFEVHEKAAHEELVVDIPGSWKGGMNGIQNRGGGEGVHIRRLYSCIGSGKHSGLFRLNTVRSMDAILLEDVFTLKFN